MIENFTWIDTVVFIIFVSSFSLSVLRGLIYEVSSILVWSFSLYTAYRFGHVFSEIFSDSFSEEIRSIGGFFTVFVVVFLISKMVILSFKEIIEKSGGGAIDKFLGGFFGLFRAALMVLILSLLGTMTALTEEEAWRSAVTRPYLEYSISLVIPYLPGFINESIKINFE